MSVTISGDTGLAGAATGALNGTLGATTPSTVVATTVTATGLISGVTNYTGFKNRIINGAMVIDQRNAGASVTVTGTQFGVDRMASETNVSSKFSIQQSTTAPAGFVNSLLHTSLATTSVGATDYYMTNHYIEGFNIADLGWGTANASTITLSFWVRSSLTGTFGGCLNNGGNTRSYPFTYTISVANTFEQKTVTIAGDTSGTWTTNNTRGICLRFGLGIGSTYSGTAGAWSGSTYFGATGATSVVGTSGATFYITGVQLEKGSTATSFDYRDYGRELIMCQRYYENTYPLGVAVGSVTTASMQTTNAANGYIVGSNNWKVSKRANPTVVFYTYSGIVGQWHYGSVGQTETIYTPANAAISTYYVNWYNNLGVTTPNVTYGLMTASAEL